MQTVLKFQRRFRKRIYRSKKKKTIPSSAEDDSLDILDTYHCNGVKGYCIYLCGSTGIVGDSLRYLRMMAGMGYVLLAPDMMVSAVSTSFHSLPGLACLRPWKWV